MLKLKQTQLLLHTKTSTTNKVKNSMKSNWVFCRTTKFRQGRESWLTKKKIETRIKSKVKRAYAYWEPDERRSNKQRLRSGHSAFWVGLNTAFPSLFRRTPFLPGSLPSQPKPALCRCLYDSNGADFRMEKLGPVQLWSKSTYNQPKIITQPI